MSDISVLGLGLMGSALAGALQRDGHSLTVWNRSPEKMQPLVAAGACGASDVAAAVTASPVILVCIDNYEATHGLLGQEAVVSHVSGRTVLQLSTGTPREALESAAWMEDRGATYIDGAVLAGPDNLRAERAQILFAGPRDAFTRVEPLVKSLCSNVRYMGENIRAAAALDLAWLSQQYGVIMGVVHGAYLCETEDVDVDLYATTFPEGSYPRELAEIIGANNFADPTATLRVWRAALQGIQRQALDAGTNGEFPEFMSDLFRRASEAGCGEQDVATLVKVLRAG
jgi:3-hydroxyisobutyrate dehydrogenase-like beta-hydroxyacid dehydrogenase